VSAFRSVTTLAVVAALATPPARAQERPPRRPPLPAAADTNDWEAYYDAGVELLNDRHQVDAERAFYWSSRLEPRRAEPLFARWAAAWARDADRFGRYIEWDPKKPLPPEMLQIDSLRYRALLRNPLVFQGLIVAAYIELPGRFRDDLWTHAWLAYGTTDLQNALTSFRLALSRYPDRYGNEARFMRATTFVALHQLDSAAVELDALLGNLHRSEEAQLQHIYESKALLYYAMALLQASRGQQGAARTALERALVEDLSFHPAHVALGQLTAQRDPAGALREFEQGAAMGANDAVARFEYGAALVRAQRGTEGAGELKAAIALEPYFADPYFWLGEAMLAQHDSSAALADYQNYLARASSRAPQLGAARARVAALQPSREE